LPRHFTITEIEAELPEKNRLHWICNI